MAFLEVKNLCKQFDDNVVLKDVCFDMARGEVVSIIGSSGNGKTTLLRCLNFLETPTAGAIIVDGKTVFPVERDERQSSYKKLTFGMVFQNFNLFPQYSVLGNVTLARDVRSENVIKEQKFGYKQTRVRIKQEKEKNKQIALAILERVGLTEKINDYPCTLSGGQQQRVAIARALAMQPDILCFDEPTSALDPELTGEVLRVIKDLRDEGRTMIIVTHEIEFARKVSDRIIFMADGRIEAIVTPENLYNSNNAKLNSFLYKEE